MSDSQILAAILFFLLALMVSVASAYVSNDAMFSVFFGAVFAGCAIAATLLR